MAWTAIDVNPPNRVLRQFAGAWLAVVGSLSVSQWLASGNARAALALAAAAIVIGVAGLVRPGTVRWLFVGSSVAAFPLGWIVSEVMLALLFVGVMTPVALFFKLRGRDRLSRKRPAGQESYWKPKETPRDVRRYFRQY